MAVHSTEEADIEIGKPISQGAVKINHHVELTEEEKAEQKAIVLKRYQEEQLSKIKDQNSKPKATTTAKQTESSLFDF